MLNFFFRKVRLLLIILFFVFSSLSFITYLNYTGKLSSIDTHNSILNFFKPKYQHYILVNGSYIYKFHNLTQQIISVYRTAPGLSESFNDNNDLVKFGHPYPYNTFVFNEDYYYYSTSQESEAYKLCKVHLQIIKNYFKQNEKLFCHKRREIDTYSIVIISNKKKINVVEINNHFIKEYVNLYKKAFAKVRLINPIIKKNAELYIQVERDTYITSVFGKSAIEQDLITKDIANTYEFKINLINERYKVINNLLNSDLNNFSMEAIQFQSVEIKNNHLVLVSIMLFVFSLMISFVIFFLLSINRLYNHKKN